MFLYTMKNIKLESNKILNLLKKEYILKLISYTNYNRIFCKQINAWLWSYQREFYYI